MTTYIKKKRERESVRETQPQRALVSLALALGCELPRRINPCLLL